MISVIIPTRNRADLLVHALESLTKQTLNASEFEVLVIDNGSTDNTAEVVKNFIGRLINLSYYYEPELGLHAGRHRGLRESSGEILVYADDDIEALPTWLMAVSEGFADPELGMMGGNNLPMFIEPPPGWLKRLWEQPAKQYGGKAFPPLSILELSGGIRPLSPLHIWGCNFAIRKSVLLAAGGFNPDGMPKERIHFRGDGETYVSQYVINSGLKSLFHPDASVYHKVTPERMTIAYFHQRGFSQGLSASFSALRTEHMLDRSSKKRLNIYYKIMRWFYRKLKLLCIRDEEIRQVMKEMAAGYDEGFSYHQEAFKTDPDVRAWVLKENYL